MFRGNFLKLNIFYFVLFWSTSVFLYLSIKVALLKFFCIYFEAINKKLQSFKSFLNSFRFRIHCPVQGNDPRQWVAVVILENLTPPAHRIYFISTLTHNGTFWRKRLQVLFGTSRADSSIEAGSCRRPNQPLQFWDKMPRIRGTSRCRREYHHLRHDIKILKITW